MKRYSLIILLAMLSLTSCIREDNTPVKIPPMTGAIVSPEVGGASQPNQVWVNLSDNSSKITQRDSWDLGFYSGEEFRVILNSSIMMAVGKIENATNIDAVTPEMVEQLQKKVVVADFTDNGIYIDDPKGNYLTQTTGIAPISANDAENGVYLLNMGRKLYEGTTRPGSVYTASSENRGWKKIRILRHNNGYKIQYANLEDTTHQEMIIEKNPNYNFSFLNMEKKSLVDIQPEKTQWDLCFTVLTNLTDAGSYYTSYIFADMVLINTLGGVQAYEVRTDAGQGETSYNKFTKADIDVSKFVKDDQRIIGSNWRTATGNNGPEVFSDRFYVLKNAEGFYYKIRFIKMLNDEGYRGHPQFEYKPL